MKQRNADECEAVAPGWMKIARTSDGLIQDTRKNRKSAKQDRDERNGHASCFTILHDRHKVINWTM